MLLTVHLTTAQQTQQQPSETLFAQCMFDIQDETELNNLMAAMNQHPNAQMVRLDMYSQRAFVLTQGISTLSITDFKSWFGSYGATVSCVQIGVYGVDTMDPFPFTNCQN